MSRILWFDSVGGASGDMILAALIDLGADAAALNKALASLGTAHIRIETHPHSDHGLHGLRVHVDAHEHVHGHGHEHAHEAGHAHHRHLPDIVRLIEAAALPDTAKRRAVAVFTRLAEAEACVHNTTPDRIHFHEVGALDAIADISGACLALDLLRIDAVGFAPLPLGHGTITCAHGVIPNPAPGTVELLKGMPVTTVDEPHELVTPTGAALLSTWRSLAAVPEGATPQAVGHGFGTRALRSRPNLLRVTLFETAAPAATPADACLVLETNLDDTTPELVGALLQRLMAAGAYDAFATGIQMKKQRPGVLLTVLCAPERRATLIDLIFRESTTFGIREHLTRRTMLDRDIRQVETPHGRVRIKVGRWQGRVITASPEYDDCLGCADAAGVAVRTVYDAATAAARAAGFIDA